MADRTDRSRHIIQRAGDRLAHVEGIQQRQLILVCLHQVRQPEQHALALDRRHARPDTPLEGGARMSDGDLGIGAVTAGHLRQSFPSGRIEALEGLAADRRHEVIVDEGIALQLRRQTGGERLPIGQCPGTAHDQDSEVR